MPDLYPSRIVSLQPSATVTLAEAGALSRVVACTRYCADVCPEVRTRGIALVQDSWTAQAEQIVAAAPDLVVASVPYQIEAVAQILKAGVRFLGLAPRTLSDIYRDIVMICGAVGLASEGERIVSQMEQHIDDVSARAESDSRPLVFCEEWGKPIIHSQPWVAELIEAAGGRFLGTPGKHTTSEEIRIDDPDVILAAWCGAGDRVPLEKIIPDRGWNETKAARAGRVFCIADELLNTPAHTLLGGLDAIAWALHPDRFPQPRGIRRIAQ